MSETSVESSNMYFFNTAGAFEFNYVINYSGGLTWLKCSFYLNYELLVSEMAL